MSFTKKHFLAFLLILLAIAIAVTTSLVKRERERHPLAHIEVVEAAFYYQKSILVHTCTPEEIAYVEEQLRAFEATGTADTRVQVMEGEHTDLWILDAEGHGQFINIRYDAIVIGNTVYTSATVPLPLRVLYEELRA